MKKPKPSPVPYLATGVPYPAHSPTNWAQAFDKIQQMFGFGDWDESSGEEYWRWRLTQIGIWKRVCGQRKIEPWDLYLAALYAREYQERVEAFSWLCGLVPRAKRWWVAEARDKANELVDAQWEAAVRYEQENRPDGEWLVMLLRASDRGEVLVRWQEAKDR